MAYEITKKIFRVAQKGTYVVSLPKAWVKINGLDMNRNVKMIIEQNK